MKGMSAGRVGLLLPSSNTTMEPDFYRMAPEGVTVHSARMTLRSVTVERLEEMSGEATKAAELLATAGVGVIVFGCTSGSLLKGVEWERSLVSRIRDETGIPTVSTAGAVVEGLKSLGVHRVSVATPYTEDINLLEKRFLEAHGFVVEAIQGLGLVDNLEIAAVSPERVMELVGEVAGDSDGVFISCTNLPVVSLISGLEAGLGRPLVASNQASMWAVLRALRHRGVDGYGKLLEVL
jgi:maleate isomerase